MFEVEALPSLRALSRSDDIASRAVFLRIYFDLLDARRIAGESMPESWLAALRASLAQSRPVGRSAALAPLTQEDVEAALRHGDLETWIAAARSATLSARQMETLIGRAQALAGAGDARLAQALLARGPLGLEIAPLFLEADAEQRRALMLAAQRAELARHAAPTRPLEPATAERLEFAAIAGAGADFVEALAEALGAPIALARRLAGDPEALVVALAALGAPRDLGVRVLTARDIGEGAGKDAGFPRLHALTQLAGQLAPSAARRLLDALAGAPVAQRAAPKAPPPRQAETPSPFARREPPARAAEISPETSRRSAQNSRRP